MMGVEIQTKVTSHLWQRSALASDDGFTSRQCFHYGKAIAFIKRRLNQAETMLIQKINLLIVEP
jgi:hypothetical protein